MRNKTTSRKRYTNNIPRDGIIKNEKKQNGRTVFDLSGPIRTIESKKMDGGGTAGQRAGQGV